MSAPSPLRPPGVAWFRTRLLVTMMLVVGGITALALFIAQRSVMAAGRRDLEQDFRRQLTAFHTVQTIRQAVLAERCRRLARRPRIHAALEDNALDLLYLSARDELADAMEGPDSPAAPRARFYRFLDEHGAVIPPADTADTGEIAPEVAAALNLRHLPSRNQFGYLWRTDGQGGETLDEVVAVPIHSTETGRPISALVLGYPPPNLHASGAPAGIMGGIWTRQRLHLPGVPPAERVELAARIGRELGHDAGSFDATVGGVPSLLFCQRINPGSSFPPAYEIGVYPLTQYLERQRRLRGQFAASGAILLLVALAASHPLASRLARPVEKLAVDSEENRAGRRKAEFALRQTHEELERSTRFSADASHQLKTPVTVLRAGLEQLLAEDALSPAAREEVGMLVHQTFRLAGVIDDLLLLSRMDAGQLRLQLAPLDMLPLIEGLLDDLSVLPDPFELGITTELPLTLPIAGERRYTTLILQNLLENARKYNRPGGRIHLCARVTERETVLVIGNTGPGIPADLQPRLFQRFQRGSNRPDLPGHGLGLNFARELAHLHGGDVRLVSSDADWTEFEVLFSKAPRAAPAS